MKRRLLIAAALSLSALATGVCAAAANSYPTKPVIIIAPSGPGGGFDFIGRVMAESLTKQFPGSGQQLLATTFARSTDTRLLQIPYKSAQAAYQDLLAGCVDLFIDSLPSARVHVDSKRAKAIFVTTQKRNATLAGVPTAREVALPALEMGTWFGLLAPRATPVPVVAQLRSTLVASMQNAELRKRLEQSGIEIMDLKPAETDAFIKAEYDKWTTVIKQAGITAD